MDLENSTPLPAEVVVAPLDHTDARIGVAVAKATFRFDASGRIWLDRENAHPLLTADEETRLGLLPTDFSPRKRGDETFEVMLVGAAHAGPEQMVTETTVALAVGEQMRRMKVFGNRRWEGRSFTAPEPFDRMPLDWSRAFGGKIEVWLDQKTSLEISDPFNSHGRGFDGESRARQLAKELGVQKGYPLVRGDSLLPNLENPADLITSRSSTPRPYCWAPIPTDIGFLLFGNLTNEEAASTLNQDQLPDLRRAHPDWIIERPTAGAMIRLCGLTPEADLSFRLPPLRVWADWTVAAKEGSHELKPISLVLLPEERGFYLVYRLQFSLDYERAGERALRLRLEEGWYPPGTKRARP